MSSTNTSKYSITFETTPDNAISASNLTPSERKSLDISAERMILERYKEAVGMVKESNSQSLSNYLTYGIPIKRVEHDSFENYRKNAIKLIEKEQGPFISGDYELNPDFTFKNPNAKISKRRKKKKKKSKKNDDDDKNSDIKKISIGTTKTTSQPIDDFNNTSSRIRKYSSKTININDPLPQSSIRETYGYDDAWINKTFKKKSYINDTKRNFTYPLFEDLFEDTPDMKDIYSKLRYDDTLYGSNSLKELDNYDKAWNDQYKSDKLFKDEINTTSAYNLNPLNGSFVTKNINRSIYANEYNEISGLMYLNRWHTPFPEFYQERKREICKWDDMFDSVNTSEISSNIIDDLNINESENDKDEGSSSKLKKSKCIRRDGFSRYMKNKK